MLTFVTYRSDSKILPSLGDLSADLIKRIGCNHVHLPVNKEILFHEDFLHNAFKQVKDDWVVAIDSDAFLVHPTSIFDIMAHMNKEGYIAAGMSEMDGHRQGDPRALSAFFYVLNRSKLPHWDGSKVWDESKFNIQAKGKEPFHAFTFWLREQGKILYLKSSQVPEFGANGYLQTQVPGLKGISTVLHTPAGKEFLVHSWYSRYWNVDKNAWDPGLEDLNPQRLRIQRLVGSLPTYDPTIFDLPSFKRIMAVRF